MGKDPVTLWLLGVIVYLRICFVSSQNTSNIDESTLLAFKANINSTILSRNWSQETSYCAWIGVVCSTRNPRSVTGLNLSSMGLEGSISREIGNLSFLTFLDLSNNSMTGPIPVEIGSLRNLEGLYLSTNQLSGDIPTSLAGCVELRTFDLSGNNLTGTIPAGFGNLSQLRQLSLSSNLLTGEVPSTIFNISSLRTIQLGFNQMHGTFPYQLCNQLATNLENLELHYNQFGGNILSSLTHCHSLKTISLAINTFTGEIPTEFWNLSAIQNVGIGRNNFTGTIPSSIANMSNLEVFDAVDNGFYGPIPPEIGQGRLSRLNWFAFDNNRLSGEVPESLFNLSSLRVLSLEANNLSGVLPESLGRGLPLVEYLFLDRNNFRGKIPDSVSNLSRLQILDLSNNSFSGIMPINLGNLTQLQRLSLGYNQLTNNLSDPEQDFLSSLANCQSLEAINIEFNPITGVLPRALGSLNLSSSLQRFTAQSCRIMSPLPDEIGNLSNLQGLDLGYNDFTGEIPGALGSLTNLQKLDIYGNKWEGQVFNVLCQLKSLYYVDIRENGFFGQIPECLRNLSMLREINLADNAFNSSIPSAFWSHEGIEKANFSNNILDGSLSPDIGNMQSLRELDLSGNHISGEIPSSVSRLQSLVHLSLSNNNLSGPINESLADLTELQYLDLSQNNFSGIIPKTLEELALLTYFNVSFNELSGQIPDGGPFVNFTPEFFVGNEGLCGAPRFQLEACKNNNPRSSSNAKLLKYILPPIASVFLVALILILVLRNRRVKSSSPSFPVFPAGQMHQKIPYQDVLSATSNLDEENLIGRGGYGSVYKGYFSNAMVVAIKVFNQDVEGAPKSFDIECQMMHSMRHRNLVKVITSCTNRDFKALVMAYMPNGNLERWLYSTDGSLNIFQRLRIMIDVASALEYLHEGSVFPIAHCDLKPSNILLDEDMVAHVGDFGIAKLLTEEQRMQQTRTLGTIGYMAPEYGSSGLISTMVDVYSFGILLMEMLSRKRPTDEMFSGELSMKRWVSESFPDSVMNIVDDKLLNKHDESSRARFESCLISTIELALGCTADSPGERPTMKDVAAIMNKINFRLSNYKNDYSESSGNSYSQDAEAPLTWSSHDRTYIGPEIY